MLVNGEDLTPYRAASKAILGVLQAYGTCERLGMDEVFVDMTQVRVAPSNRRHDTRQCACVLGDMTQVSVAVFDENQST